MVRDQRSKFKYQRLKIKYQGSKIKDRRLKIKDNFKDQTDQSSQIKDKPIIKNKTSKNI